MSAHSKIEWTDATWNPITGCSIHSPGCINCYAMKLAGTRLRNHPSRKDLTKDSKGGAVWTGEVRFNEGWLTQPLHWRKPRMVFVCAHGDLFHEDVPDAWIDRVFAVMALAPQHTFQVLTKRAKRMRRYLTNADQVDAARVGIRSPGFTVVQRVQALVADYVKLGKFQVGGFGPVYREDWERAKPHLRTMPLSNVWLGVSAERQQEADERIPNLLQTPATVRFLSIEPLLGPIDIDCPDVDWMKFPEGNGIVGDGLKFDWVIVGGESGDRARPMQPDWARSLRDQCAGAGVPFFFKQWGEYLPVGQSLPDCGKVHGATAVKPGRMKLHYGGSSQQAPKHAFAERGVDFASTVDGRLTFRVGKKKAGRLLDGVEHNGIPERRSA